ncbi:unnamed protein product [Arctia plantaginis]|uniref:Uncharacterized protein n=1 Tax=Arctia plantaginis TaxID=874455 RepID=A0A8S1BAM0_ARCPL|nr:unnamed protein product [Arctia plantaginis]CAB3255971.1 unnamed protein product [Arctia plantaginis]
MLNKYTTFYLVVLVAVVSARAENINLSNALQNSNVLKDSRRWDGLGLTATVNDYVDLTLTYVTRFIESQGLDPMPLPDIEEGFEVRPIWVTYSALLRVYDGRMTGLTRVSRYGDQQVSYFAKMLRVRLQLQFSNLEIIYRYIVRVMNIGPSGGITALLERFNVVVDVLIDFNNDEIHLQEFKLTDVGRLRVQLTGNPLVDWLVNPVINVFTRMFNGPIIRAVQTNIRSAVQSQIDVLNGNLQAIIARLESHN